MAQVSSSPWGRPELPRRTVLGLPASLLKFLHDFYAFFLWYVKGFNTSLELTILQNKKSIFLFKFIGHAYFTLYFLVVIWSSCPCAVHTTRTLTTGSLLLFRSFIFKCSMRPPYKSPLHHMCLLEDTITTPISTAARM